MWKTWPSVNVYPVSQVGSTFVNEFENICISDPSKRCFLGTFCQISTLIPNEPIAGQGGWIRNRTVGSNDPLFQIVEEIRTPLPLYVLQGTNSWFSSNLFATPTAYIQSPVFNKIIGESTINQTVPINAPQFLGGDTTEMNVSFIFPSSVPDGSRVTVGTCSSQTNLCLFDFHLDYNTIGNGSLTLTVMNGSVILHNLNPQQYYTVFVVVHTIDGENNDNVTMYFNTASHSKPTLIYRGGSYESRFAQPQPIDCIRFNLGESATQIGFQDNSPQGQYWDLFYQRQYFMSEGINNIYQTSFESPPCLENFTFPCLNNGTCVPTFDNQFCLCADGFSGM